MWCEPHKRAPLWLFQVNFQSRSIFNPFKLLLVIKLHIFTVIFISMYVSYLLEYFRLSPSIKKGSRVTCTNRKGNFDPGVLPML